jgi:hypothetical protein
MGPRLARLAHERQARLADGTFELSSLAGTPSPAKVVARTVGATIDMLRPRADRRDGPLN